MIKGRPPVLLIAGPTASGKSALALAAAERWGGAVVNADSAQVYADLSILSARPSAADEARAPHRLYGCWDAAEPCSAADWAAAAKAEIDALHAAGRLPVLCGGTGLYLRTLLDGIAPVPPIDPAVRAEVRSRSVAENRAELERLDPDRAAKLNAADTTRIARALEVVRSTGRTLAEWQAERSGGIGDAIQLRPLVLLPPRDWLYRRCDQRFAAMLDLGAADEVERLLSRRLDPALPAMRAIGVREVSDWSAGRTDRAAALAAGQQATRRYAKRQYTWFAHQPPADWPRFTAPLDEPGAVEAALALLAPAA
ncbi:tRNA (adenosine(37)-N6)-dimethylallyltransferase MiaA [Sphingomonas ginkgonis]|uniref:tRNA dimethylallyltransferase n=1 Tax=Sphingomonas ginkgonis TaxID=2315330 RepID=A0A429VB52_9SPHN|nr:tRNA (adenosine(37)-N6)-dimethylallyltransferase MiaA [Sphingomonas ginkgonis]RST31181.1 tRNA (adenosine(37)-N6)-dimethylallyltransferase MiaA [Sphingomonas ginkgonis]